MGIARRKLLGGMAAAAAVAALPRAARAQNADATLKAVLDGLASAPSYGVRRARIDAFDPATLSLSSRIDLLALRTALAVDAELAEVAPGGKQDGPYRVPLPAEPGLWRLPKGEHAFRLLLERQTGAEIEPLAAHSRFGREAAKLTARADRLMRGLGHSRGTVGERFEAMFADQRWHFSNDDAGRDTAVALMNRALDHARARVPALVGPVPAECLDVSARRMSRADEAAGKGGYREISAPGKSGAYYVDLKDIARRPRWTLASVVHHELLPGHMIQLPIEAAAGAHPLRIAYLSAFPEAWAIHAETMMAADGVYRGDPLGELGHIHWLLFRVGRGLVDTGIHIRRWTPEDAKARLKALHGVSAYFAPIDSDVDRIVRDPATRAAEAMAWLTLADRAAATRAPAQLRLLNQAILAGGRKPLGMIR